MIPFIIILLVAGVSLFAAFKKKRPILLAVPFLSIFLYFVVEVIMFPAPILDTIKFIFNLR
ncbi:hypothetical protein [Litchfieldia salsa]|uniref:Uncharacterized protein n=1 Tax=Litchfieldia salsa TaxID=930152 RepID=A0A1H0U268_9BACI|nr:hypothetical protein [Litchfieldia salsa]SDP60264.1 hypothetical protein SAMN05216565_104100 [Litchfieldia salsa]